MKSYWLKKIRVVFGLFFLVSVIVPFIDFTHTFPTGFLSVILYFQFVPSLIKALNPFTWAATGFLMIILLTLFGGRVYCSAICPLGILQDVVIYLSGKIKGRKRSQYHFSKALTILRYSLLGLTVIPFLLGSIFFVSFFDPYSVFGRIFSNLIRPVVIMGNNLGADILSEFNYFGLNPIEAAIVSMHAVAVALIFLLGIIWLSVTKGRLYCNSICPVGTLLGVLARMSWMRITIDTNTCTSCGLCERACKAGCINITEQKVDLSRCVVCYNCLGVCPVNSIQYTTSVKSLKKSKPIKIERPGKEMDPSRRKFFLTLLMFLGTMVRLGKSKTKVRHTATVPVKKRYPVSPPGSVGIGRFNESCIACHMCVSACPAKVLQPSLWEYGVGGFLQPHLDNSAGYCNYDCTRCSQVCPTGAILPITKESKQIVQIGVAKFIKDNCIVNTEGTDCGACAEHCPTKAVRMIPYQGDLKIPKVDEDICVGCGACEHACPTTPWKAIYVEGNPVHQIALKPKEEKQEQVVPEEDFPF